MRDGGAGCRPAPPGLVVLSLGVLPGDIVVAGIGLGLGTVGVALVIGLGKAVTKLF